MQLLVSKAGPLLEETVSMLIVVLVGVTNLERQSCCFISGSRNPLKGDVICSKLQTPSLYVASSKLLLLTLLLVFFPLKKFARGLWLFLNNDVSTL